MLLEIIRLKSVFLSITGLIFGYQIFLIDSIGVIYLHKSRNDDNLKIDGTK